MRIGGAQGAFVDILSFEQAWRDQEHLDELSREPVDFRNPEKLAHNAGYGFADILKAYAGYPLEMPVEAIIPHGVYLDPSKILETEARSILPAVLNYPAYRARAWDARGDKAVIPSASPFLYALDRYRRSFGERENKAGTIFYAAHSMQGSRTTADWEAVADELTRLEERFQPVTACLHMRDYVAGSHGTFVSRGIRVVCAGRVTDPSFMYRWLHLLEHHRYAASNDVGSAVFYAVAAGTPVLLTQEIVRHVFEDPARLVLQSIEQSRAQVEQARDLRNRLIDLFRADRGQRGTELIEVVDYLLGAENFKTPEGLRADLEYAASLAG